MKRTMLTLLALVVGAGSAQGAVVATTIHSDGGFGNPGTVMAQIASDDLLQQPGVVGVESNAATGWHPATPALEKFTTLTDGLGPTSGLSGLVNDFSPAPVNMFTYSLPNPTDIGTISLIGGNAGGDGRVFLTFRVEVSTDNGANFVPLGGFVPGVGNNANGYYQSDASGSINVSGNAANISGDPSNPYEETRVLLTDTTGVLAAGVTDIRIGTFDVGNTQGRYQDPYTGVNPFTGVDDGFDAAVEGTLLWEIDVTAAVPEPGTVLLLAGMVVGGVAMRRRLRY